MIPANTGHRRADGCDVAQHNKQDDVQLYFVAAAIKTTCVAGVDWLFAGGNVASQDRLADSFVDAEHIDLYSLL